MMPVVAGLLAGWVCGSAATGGAEGGGLLVQDANRLAVPIHRLTRDGNFDSMVATLRCDGVILRYILCAHCLARQTN